MALWSIESAIKTRNCGQLSAHIDWTSLNRSLKTDCATAIAGPPAAADDLPDFGTSFASNAVSNAIDTKLTPDTVLSVADQMMPKPDARAVPEFSLAALSRLSAHFVSPARFEAAVSGAGGQPQMVVHLKFEHWHWKITRLEMPTQVASAGTPAGVGG